MLLQIQNFLLNCWNVLGQMSPYLLLGFLISGILSVFISPEWVEKHLGSGKFGAIVKATLFGIPLPLCSCGVIPVAASLRKHGASKGATTSFLLSTPQTGVDSILATWGLLGGVFAIFRPIAALITGLIGGTLVWLLDVDFTTRTDKESENAPQNQLISGFAAKAKAAISYGFISLPGEIAKALAVGILIAGIISTFVTGNILDQYLGNYYLTMLVMLIVGVPLYVCSTSSIPIALGFIHLGASPGAALVFLISGPATNAAAISVVWNILGKRSTVIYLATVVFGSLAGGIAFDMFDQKFALNAMEHLKHGGHGVGIIGHISAVLMIVILVYSYYKLNYASDASCCSSCSEKAGNISDTKNIHTHILNIQGMSCTNCSKAITRTLLEIEGVMQANVSLKNKQAEVKAGFKDGQRLANAVNELGYKATIIKETD
jgi:uncharacterized membrane protein YraQ (UPF0718 family)/copper chaperone CopZ